MQASSRILLMGIAILFVGLANRFSDQAGIAFVLTWLLRAVVIAPIALCVGALWASGFSEARARWLRARTRRPDARGRRTLQGVARPLARETAEALVTQVSTEHLVRRFRRHAWVPRISHVAGGPFELTLRSGEVVEVDATSFLLEGFAEASRQNVIRHIFEPPRHEVTVKLQPEDEVWVTGVLTTVAAPRGGAYRGSGGAHLRAPQGESVVVAKKPPWARWSALARAHRSGALFGLLAVGLEVLAYGLRSTLTGVHALDGEGARSGEALILVLGGIGLAVAVRFYGRKLAEVQR